MAGRASTWAHQRLEMKPPLKGTAQMRCVLVFVSVCYGKCHGSGIVSSLGCESCLSKCSSLRVWRERIIHKIALLQTPLSSKSNGICKEQCFTVCIYQCPLATLLTAYSKASRDRNEIILEQLLSLFAEVHIAFMLPWQCNSLMKENTLRNSHVSVKSAMQLYLQFLCRMALS